MNISAQVVELFGSDPSRNNSTHLGRTRTCRTEDPGGQVGAMSNDEGGKETPPGSECPVCYEQLQTPNTAERRLNCGHSFCHDCLVKYLLSAKQEGSVRKNIICPLCRYVTFLSKGGLILPPKSGERRQTLEVPISPSCQRHCESARSPNTVEIPISDTETTAEELPACTCQAAISPEGLSSSFGSQVFIISDQGQPLESVEVAPAQSTVLRRRDNVCRSPVLIVILLLIFLVAILAAVLPWILLAKRV
ncbi:hypothetical protein XENTR_v10004510 [Xenopus tropicalis]|uniref:Ring finger protein 222 n=2 Tax=Xenopus tropicalis TaxID=8364 RepID=A0A6R4ZVC2_XENTR